MRPYRKGDQGGKPHNKGNRALLADPMGVVFWRQMGEGKVSLKPALGLNRRQVLP